MDINGIVTLAGWSMVFIVGYFLGKNSAYSHVLTVYGSPLHHCGQFQYKQESYYVLNNYQYKNYIELIEANQV